MCLVLRYGYNAIEVSHCSFADKSLYADGGGVRGYSSLLIIKAIMLKIREVERSSGDCLGSSSSAYPWIGLGNEDNPTDDNRENSDRVDDFLPCHYFDYIAGTSTGG